jgi:DNA-directed RNA polymerase specialized sigma24 family protein
MIDALTEGLPYSFREVLVLRDVEDMSYRELADVINIIACMITGTGCEFA